MASKSSVKRAADLAAEFADGWVDALLSSTLEFASGAERSPLDEAFEAVGAAVKRERSAVPPDEFGERAEYSMIDLMCTREAAYLIGVQVGLRLRKA